MNINFTENFTETKLLYLSNLFNMNLVVATINLMLEALARMSDVY